MIPEKGDKVILNKDDYYSERKKGDKGEVIFVSLWYGRADILFEDGSKSNVHFDNLERCEA